MSPVRIHLGPMPEMLRSIVTDLLLTESDIEIVGQSDDGALGAAREEGADVIITQEYAGDGSGCLQAILSPEPLAVVALSADGTNAAAVSLYRQSIPLDPSSGTALARAVRSLAGSLAGARPS